MKKMDLVLPETAFELCPIRSSMGVLGRKWALMVLRDVAFLGETSFSDFMKHNNGLTPRVLSMRLKDLREEGLIERIQDPTDSRIVRHRITRKGRDAVPILTALIQYGASHHANRVFEDGRPRNVQELFPNRQKLMLGQLLTYARDSGFKSD
jgi:DNA-binding HxlR family transcriptional regulator